MNHLKTKVQHLKRRLSKDDSSSTHNGRFVLITHGSGYVATWIIRQFLSNGYQVRTTVCSKVEAQDVRDTHSKYAHNLETAAVGEGGGFEEAVKGVDGVVHCGLDGATVDLLESIRQHGSEVRRVVLTSSLAAVVDPSQDPRPGYVYSEKDWSPDSSEEKAAHAFVQEKSPNFSLATICPAMVWGPLAHKTDLDGVKNSELGEVWKLMEGETQGSFKFPAFVDVRNVAQVHLRAYERDPDDEDDVDDSNQDHGEGERYIVSGGTVNYAQACAALRECFPEWKFKIPDPKSLKEEGETYSADNTKAEEVLGMSFISLEDCLRDMGQSLLDIADASKKAVRYDGQEWFSHV